MAPISFREQLSDRLVEFCWDEWAQMGVMASATRVSHWSADPEALIVFTLEVGRADPRLFDEVLDWMLLNERALSVRRLRAMCIDSADRALVDAAIGWLGWQRPRPRLRVAVREGEGDKQAPLFPQAGPVLEADPSFLAAGLLRPRLLPSGKSRPPDLLAPINLGLRLRAILGVSIRAEVIRVMLGTESPWMTAQALAQATGYAKRNVHEALSGLADAQLLAAYQVNGEQRYAIDKSTWSAFLGCSSDALPSHRDWPQLFGALRTMLRWAERDATQAGSSTYLLGSNVRQLLDELHPALSLAGISHQRQVTAASAIAELERVTNSLLIALKMDPIAPALALTPASAAPDAG